MAIKDAKSKKTSNLMQKMAKQIRLTKFGPESDTFPRYFMARRPERRDILKNEIGRNHYSYGSGDEEVLVLNSCNWKIHPGVLLEDVKLVCDKLGQRSEFNRLTSRLNRGDVLGITSVAALEDEGKPKSLIQRLRKLERNGIILSVAYGPAYHFSAYDDMYRQLEILEDQRDFYRKICVKSLGYVEKVHVGSTLLEGGE